MAHVLLVDDDRAIGELLASVLAEGGHTCELVPAVDEAARRAPDVIVTDLVGLGDFTRDAASGYVRRVRAQFRGVPIVVCTAHRAADVADIGADAVVTKPFDIETMLAVVDRVARHRP